MQKQFEFVVCPKCKSENITADTMEHDSDSAWRVVTCDDCGFSWREVFVFSHNEDKDCNMINENGETESAIEEE